MMADESAAEEMLAPFKISWIDRLEEFLERRRTPYWLLCTSAALVLFGIGLCLQAIESNAGLVDFDPLIALSLFQSLYFFYLMHYLDREALRALQRTRARMRISEGKVPAVIQHLTQLPSRPTLGLTVLVVILVGVPLSADAFVLSGRLALSDFNPETPVTNAYGVLVLVLVWMVNVIFLYHLLRQSKTVNHLLRWHSDLRLFRQRDLYAFSAHGARTTAAFILPPILWTWLDPGTPSLVIALVFGLLGLFAFLFPLVGIHRRLAGKKDDLLDRLGARMEASVEHVASADFPGDEPQIAGLLAR
jgi:hypothetical protein